MPRFSAGGAERVLVSLANHMYEEIDIRIGAIREEGPLASEIHPRVGVVPLGGRILWPVSLLKFVWRHKHATLISSAWDINFVLMLLRFIMPKGIRLIVREPLLPIDAARSNKLWRMLLPLYSALYRSADGIIVFTAQQERHLRESAPHAGRKIAVIPNAPEPGRCYSPETTHEPLDDPPLLLAVGRLVPQKGFDTLIEAFALLLRRGYTAQLAIAGTGPDLHKLKGLAAQAGISANVNFLGHTNDVPMLLVRAHAFVLASMYEGMCNALLEALCSGTPVVAVPSRNNGSDLICTGQNGWIARSRSTTDLCLAMIQAIQKGRTLDRSAIASRARELFSFERTVLSYKEIMFGNRECTLR